MMNKRIEQRVSRAINGDSQAACSVPSPLVGPLWERVAAASAFTRVFDALWRRGEGCSGHPTKAPLTPTLSHSASKTRVNALMLRQSLGRGSRCARGEGVRRVRGTAVLKSDRNAL